MLPEQDARRLAREQEERRARAEVFGVAQRVRLALAPWSVQVQEVEMQEQELVMEPKLGPGLRLALLRVLALAGAQGRMRSWWALVAPPDHDPGKEPLRGPMQVLARTTGIAASLPGDRAHLSKWEWRRCRFR